MKKLSIILLPLIIALTSCMSFNDFWNQSSKQYKSESPINFSSSDICEAVNTYPRNGNPVFFASVQRMSNRELEEEAALRKAADQASRYYSVNVVSKFYSEKVNTSFRYMDDLDASWDLNLSGSLYEDLSIIESWQDNYGSYVLAELQGHAPPVIISPRSADKEPSWINNTPEIPGYITSVGITLQKGYVADSFEAAEEQALAQMAKQISISVSNGQVKLENSIGTVTTQSNLEIAEASIQGFYILDRWRTPDSRYYYALAVCPADKNRSDD